MTAVAQVDEQLVALVRGFVRRGTDRLGNAWVDITRAVVRLLLPLAVVATVVLVLGGVIQNLRAGTDVTTLAGGSQFGYGLLAVILLSNLIAMLFQAAAVRLGIGAGLDLAQACRQQFPPRVSIALWLLCEVAIVACNLAEVIGTAMMLGYSQISDIGAISSTGS